jgi:NADH:ubiquinone reductase (H+-translocating)
VVNLPHVAVVGGGFGGLYAAQALAARQVRVTLLDRRNHHLFQPLLYQVATAALNASDIAAPLRSILRRAHNVTKLLAEVTRVDLAAHRLVLDRGEVGYDALILAAGAGHSYFGHEEWETFAPA